jgi:hypothetical protein
VVSLPLFCDREAGISEETSAGQARFGKLLLVTLPLLYPLLPGLLLILLLVLFVCGVHTWNTPFAPLDTTDEERVAKNEERAGAEGYAK